MNKGAVLFFLTLLLTTVSYGQEDCVFEFNYRDSYAKTIKTILEKERIKRCYTSRNKSVMTFLDQKTNDLISVNSYACTVYSTVVVINTFNPAEFEGSSEKINFALVKNISEAFDDLIDLKAVDNFITSLTENSKLEYSQKKDNFIFRILVEECKHGNRITISMTFN